MKTGVWRCGEFDVLTLTETFVVVGTKDMTEERADKAAMLLRRLLGSEVNIIAVSGELSYQTLKESSELREAIKEIAGEVLANVT